ncbi:carbamoyltransferase HypF, partial [Myxococcota bacterium]|nr:carbamoyltransferase HypF [Myxococcota bacterium]
MKRFIADITGAVQGVGFRPFVYRLASQLSLSGWVRNDSQGVHIEVEGSSEATTHFFQRLENELPPAAFISTQKTHEQDPTGSTGFEIRHSEGSSKNSALILPDLGPCKDCLRELDDPDNRRFLYPFTNCTNCGPRYSIIADLPYDRPQTSMSKFTMCEACQKEYDDPGDRRFHAQPNACP